MAYSQRAYTRESSRESEENFAAPYSVWINRKRPGSAKNATVLKRGRRKENIHLSIIYTRARTELSHSSSKCATLSAARRHSEIMAQEEEILLNIF